MTTLSTEHIPAPSGTAGFGVTTKAIAVRTARKILRSPPPPPRPRTRRPR